MERIYLSDSGPKVSPAIYGFYRWSGNDINEGKMERIMNLCLELDINTFDHGDVYGGYACEELFGTVFKRNGIKREKVVLFTKCGINIPHPSRPEYRSNITILQGNISSIVLKILYVNLGQIILMCFY